MNDERGNGASEDARRFYRQNNAAAAVVPGERLVRTAPVPAPRDDAERAVVHERSDATSAPVDDNERALGEKPTQGSGGPGILNRSFSGTYEE